MATSMQGIVNLAETAGEDLSAALFTFAVMHSDGLLYQANSGEAVLGVIVEGAAEGSPASVQCDAIAKVTLGATLNAGDRVMSDNAGKAVAAIDSPAGNVSAGILLAGGAANEVVPILLHA